MDSGDFILYLEKTCKDIADNIRKNDGRIKREVLRKILKDTIPYMPYDTGNLSDSLVVNASLDAIVVEDVPYAGYVLDGKEKNFNKLVHPLASSTPLEDAYDAHKDEWMNYLIEEVLKYVNTE